MAVVMKLRWEGLTPEQYDRVRHEVDWEGDTPEGGLFHVAWFENGGLQVIDAWKSAEQFQQFVDQRLMPVAKGKLKIPGEPAVEIAEAYRVFDARNGQVVEA